MKKRRRGVSLGTVLTLFLTLVVSLGCAWVLPRLSGGSTVQIDAQQVVSALTKDLNLPELRLENIPIFQANQRPAAAATQPPKLDMDLHLLSTPQPQVIVTHAPTATPAPQEVSFTLTAGGSITLSEPIRKSAYHDESETYDFSELFDHISPETQSDLCLVTLENTLDDASRLSDVNLGAQAAESLLTLGADVVALGFPKMLDTGLPSLNTTISQLRQSGFSVIGAHQDAASAAAPLILNLKGVDVALLHYTDELSSKGKSAVKKNDAAYAAPLAQIQTIQTDIAAVRAKGAEVVIVSLNWGDVGKTAPTKAQKQLAQQIADAGADMILGAHGQVIQPIEYLTATRPDGTTHQVLTAYSLGALMTESRETKNIAGMLLQLHLTYHPVTQSLSFDRVEYTPTYIWRYKDDGRYRYRCVISDQAPPDGMDESQQKVMAKILDYACDALEGSPVALR